MGIAALVSWLLTESAGAFMLRSWIASGGLRRRGAHAEGMSVPVLFGHAGLAASGLTCWVIFLATGSAVPALLAVVILAPAIGLGISTLTVWTPFPTRPPAAASSDQPARPAPPSDDAITRALDDERLTERLVDAMLAGLFARPERDRSGRERAQVLIPAAHGMLAIVTFLLAILAVVGAVDLPPLTGVLHGRELSFRRPCGHQPRCRGRLVRALARSAS